MINLDNRAKGAKIVLVGDTHINSTVALSKRVVQLDSGGTWTAGRAQNWVADQWAEFLDLARAFKRRQRKWPLVVIHHGEVADLLKYATTELISLNQDDLLMHAIDVMEELVKISDYYFQVRGTEAHVGLSGWMDSTVARDLGAIQPEDGVGGAFKRLRLILGGAALDVAHHPGTGHKREHTAGGDAVRLAADVVAEYTRVNQRLQEQGDRPLPLPKLVSRGHNHKAVDSGPINQPTRAIILPSWQLTNAFGHRLGGTVLDIGGAFATATGGEIEDLRWFLRAYPQEEPWTVYHTMEPGK